MKIRRVLCAATVVLSALSLGACSAPAPTPTRALGAPASLGNGTVASYAEFDASGAPKVIGVAFSAGALEALPTAPSDGHRCFDANRNGVIDLATECAAWHERVLPVPSEASRRADVPFKWALLNWNPHGHMPPDVFDKPHFDVHFYIEPIENIFAIARGPCGPEFVRCDQFALARKPVHRQTTCRRIFATWGPLPQPWAIILSTRRPQNSAASRSNVTGSTGSMTEG